MRKRGNSYEVRAYNPATKKNEYVGSRKTQREARKLERDSETEFAKHRTTRRTVEQFAEQWIELYPPPEESSRRIYRIHIGLFAKEYGDRQLTSITRLEARAYGIQHAARVGTIRKFYNDAIDGGLAHDNPFARLGLASSRGRKDLVVLTDDELGVLEHSSVQALGAAYGAHFSGAIAFAACTCIRPGELFALDWGRLDLERGRAEIAYQRRRDGNARPKRSSQRHVVVPTPAIEALEKMPRFDGDHVFGSITGLRLRAGSLLYAWDKVRNAVGRPGMDFYELRHYGATKLLELGVSAEDVAIQMGHKDGGELVRTTYGHPSHPKALDRIQRAWVRGIDSGNRPSLHVVAQFGGK